MWKKISKIEKENGYTGDSDRKKGEGRRQKGQKERERVCCTLLKVKVKEGEADEMKKRKVHCFFIHEKERKRDVKESKECKERQRERENIAHIHRKFDNRFTAVTLSMLWIKEEEEGRTVNLDDATMLKKKEGKNVQAHTHTHIVSHSVCD